MKKKRGRPLKKGYIYRKMFQYEIGTKAKSKTCHVQPTKQKRKKKPPRAVEFKDSDAIWDS